MLAVEGLCSLFSAKFVNGYAWRLLAVDGKGQANTIFGKFSRENFY